MPGRVSQVACCLCGASRRRLPANWIGTSTSDCLIYCDSCWAKQKCSNCSRCDPRGRSSQGRWLCRPCGHEQKVRFSAGGTLEECHRLIMEDQETVGPAHFQLDDTALEAKPGEESEDESEFAEAVGELPTSAAGSSWTNLKAPGHIVLLLDTSGSMRTEDVERSTQARAKEPTLITRLEAVRECTAQFLEAHSRMRPQDQFSIITFGEEAEIVRQHCGAAQARSALEGLFLRGANGTHYKPALEAANAALARQTSSGAQHIVLLSDGRPADTKDALKYFQAKGFNGEKAPQLHGIGFGGTVTCFAALQQLTCLSGGAFALSGCSVKGLCDAFASVSSTITSLNSRSDAGSAARRQPRPVDFEMPGIGAFGKRGVLRFQVVRSTFRYDGVEFHQQTWPASPVERRQLPHMRGGMRLVYGFRDKQLLADDGSWMVAKSSRFLEPALNSTAIVESHVKSTAIARHYALRFNEQLRDGGLASLFFVPCFLYERAGSLSDASPDTATEPGVFAAERYLPGVFLKYTSNNGYVNEGFARHLDVVQAFSHFTFVSSGGRLLVADLQGVARDTEVLLTDPQVLSMDGNFGPGDLRGEGMRACLAAHRCGPACKALALAPLSSSSLRRLVSSRRSHWEKLGSRRSSEFENVSVGGSSDFDKVSEYCLTDLACSDGAKSRPDSTSSWAILDM